jgi:sec-independent protein translocase protein TatA
LDLVLIALIAILLFGANRLPETARAMGKAIREFKNGLAGKSADDQAEPKRNS